MVRRLVQNQEVGGRQERPDNGQPAPLAAGQHRHLLLNGVSRKEKRPEDTLHLVFGETGPGLGCGLQHGQVGVNRLLRALLVVRHLCLLAGPCLARIRGQSSRYDAQQSGLALPVGTEQPYLLTAADHEVHVPQHVLRSVVLGHRPQVNRLAVHHVRFRKPDTDYRRGLRRLQPLQLVEHLLPAHRPRRGVLAPLVLGDELLGTLDELLLLLELLELPLVPLDLVVQVLREVPGEDEYLARLDCPDLLHQRVEEIPVVRNHHHRALERGQVLLQPLDRTDVEVVGRLVQQQHVRLLQKHPRQCQPHLEPAALGPGLLVEVILRESEAHQHLLGPRLAVVRLVPVVMLQDGVSVQHLFELLSRHVRILHPVLELNHLRLNVVQVLESGQRLLQHGTLPNHRAGLGQIPDARAPSPIDRPAGRLQLPGHQLQDCGLPRPVHAGQPDAVIRPDEQVHVAVELLRAELHRDV